MRGMMAQEVSLDENICQKDSAIMVDMKSECKPITMSQKLVLFDFDGTIVDSFPVFLSFASREGYLFDEGEVGVFRDLSMKQVIDKLGIPAWKIPFFAKKFQHYFKKASADVRLVDGIGEAIRQLHEEGCILGIVTSNSKSNVEAILEREGVLFFFDHVFSEWNVFGKAGPLKRITRYLDVAENEAWYIGDEARDVEAAREAGIQSIAVTWGFNSESALRAMRPTFLASQPDELSTLLR